MNIIVFSDSHGNSQSMIEIMQREAPEMCIFLGDGYRDIMAVQRAFPACDYQLVCGNCDRGEAPRQLCIPLGNGYRAFACHGHEYSVKFGLLQLRFAALEQGADIALFGHTHRAYYDFDAGLHMLNPGSVGDPYAPSYATITIGENGPDIQIRSPEAEP